MDSGIGKTCVGSVCSVCGCVNVHRIESASVLLLLKCQQTRQELTYLANNRQLHRISIQPTIILDRGLNGPPRLEDARNTAYMSLLSASRFAELSRILLSETTMIYCLKILVRSCLDLAIIDFSAC